MSTVTTNTRRFLLFALLALFLVPRVFADPRPRGGHDGDNDGDGGDNDNDGDGGDNDGDNDGDGAAGGAANTPVNGTAPALSGNSSLGGLQGDMQCPGSQLMCVTGVVNGSSITYELQSTGAANLGWMAIGFGTQMPNTPMVIMWANADGTITLSQRQAPATVMPTPVANPPHVATPAPQLSSLTGSQPKLVFTIPGAAAVTNLIWAFGTTKPAEPADSTLLQHIQSGTFTLDLTKTLPGGGAAGGIGGINGTSAIPLPRGSLNIPFLPYQKLIIAHAAIVSLGFLILLPSGVLLARLTRTYNNKWFKGHWILQFGLAGPAIIIGCVLGFLAVHEQGGGETHTPHKKIGQILLALYLVQCALGAFIHFVKIKVLFNRPPQNYIHALLGLTILGLAFYQARLGFTQEWPNATGRPPVSNAVSIAWIVLLAMVAVAYIGGLAYLPRQYRQEKQSRRHSGSSTTSNAPFSIRLKRNHDTEAYQEIHELNPNEGVTMVSSR